MYCCKKRLAEISFVVEKHKRTLALKGGGDKWAMKEAVSYYGGSLTTGHWVDPSSTSSVQNGMPTVTADRSSWLGDVAQNGGTDWLQVAKDVSLYGSIQSGFIVDQAVDIALREGRGRYEGAKRISR